MIYNQKLPEMAAFGLYIVIFHNKENGLSVPSSTIWSVTDVIPGLGSAS